MEMLTTPLDPRPYTGAQIANQRARDVRRVEQIARVLDGAMVDPIVGLVAPGVGDLAMSAVGLWVVGLAMRHQLPVIVIARMLMNLALDAAVGAIPVLGDLFDLVHRAHTKNAALFVARHEHRRATARDWLAVGGAVLAFAAAIVIPTWLAIALLRAIF